MACSHFWANSDGPRPSRSSSTWFGVPGSNRRDLTLLSYSFHAYQAELFPTGIRARAVGFVYSWSRFSAIFTGFVIAFVLREAGTPGVFLFISAAMLAAGLLEDDCFKDAASIAKLLYRFAFRFPREVWFLNRDDLATFEAGRLLADTRFDQVDHLPHVRGLAHGVRDEDRVDALAGNERERPARVKVRRQVFGERSFQVCAP